MAGISGFLVFFESEGSMYVIQSAACNLPNSETPMSAEDVARQDRFVAGIGRKFENGNRAMAGIIGMLTPPPPGGSCDDFTSSLSMSNITPFPWPAPRPAAGGRSGVYSTPPIGSTPGPADAFAKLSRGWQWANSGGGSTYPWGSTQLAASRLIPPWVCTPVTPGGSGLAADTVDLATAMSWAKWLALGLGGAWLISASRRGR